MKINVETAESHQLLVPQRTIESIGEVKNEWFESDYWASQERVVGQSSGRNITWFVRPEESSLIAESQARDWVLRHYYRGGMIAKVSRDKFFYTGIFRTRPYLEMQLLLEMQRLGLPVPICVAARVSKRGFSYSADLLMEKLEAEDLVKCLKSGQLSKTQWQSIGKVVALFHRQGIYHADLNAHNIMIDHQQKIWLIDFDRCQMRKPDSHWQQQNISRLKRSLVKEKGLDSSLNYDDQCWHWLTDGYHRQLGNR